MCLLHLVDPILRISFARISPLTCGLNSHFHIFEINATEISNFKHEALDQLEYENCSCNTVCMNSVAGGLMPRLHDIERAFRAAMQIEPSGRRTVTTQNFVCELEKFHWNWSLKEANTWIECYVTTFKDVTDHEGEDRTFQLFNPNGGL